MARTRMVTRTIVATLATALIADFENNALKSEVLKVGGYYAEPDDKDLHKAIKKAYPDLVVAKITALDTEETLYGIEESEFLKIARVLPPRNASADDTDDADE